ncbi:potassium channel family protein [Methanosphaera sp. BMS]|uniref:potassium channel family protein n=1 Tax=Methanosphaera sp. BMS TaxID=1789762 RepID=UPI000DC1F63B|nr:potassium channel family protein [Methanosphaera sp. BMS]AWX32105.1 hypothetical protein AW729_02880 [Methanosphaera sp. BMS]
MLDRLSENDKLVIIEFKNFILLLMVIIDFLFIGIVLFNPANSYNTSFFINYDIVVCFLLFMNLIYEYFTSKEQLLPFIYQHKMDILALIPFNYIYLRFFSAYGTFKLVQILNIFKIGSVRENYTGSFKYFVHHRLLKVISLLLICYLLMTSIILYQVDPSVTTLFNSFWYNIATISSVGYGDITPISITGKIIGIFTIIMGIMFVSVFTAAMSSIYMEKNEDETFRKIKEEVDGIESQMDDLSVKVNKLEDDISLLNDKMDILIDKMDDKEE